MCRGTLQIFLMIIREIAVAQWVVGFGALTPRT
jgi:hypothetical protein